MIKHLILPFRLAEPEGGIHLAISQAGYVTLDVPALHMVMQRLESLGWGTTLTECQLDELLVAFPRQCRAETIAYLRQSAVLRQVDEDFGRFESIRLIQEECLPIEGLEADLHYMTGIPCVSACDPTSVRENELVVLYTPSRQTSLILAAQRAVTNFHNSPLLVAYLRGRVLVLDGLFIPLARTPCHFCQSGHPAAHVDAANDLAPNWSSAVTAMTRKEPVAGMQYRVVTSDHWFCAAVIRNRIREIVGPNLEPLNARHALDRWELSLEGFQARREMTDALIECEFCQA